MLRFIRTAGCHRLSRASLVAAMEGLMTYYCKPLRTEHDLNTRDSVCKNTFKLNSVNERSSIVQRGDLCGCRSFFFLILLFLPTLITVYGSEWKHNNSNATALLGLVCTADTEPSESSKRCRPGFALTRCLIKGAPDKRSPSPYTPTDRWTLTMKVLGSGHHY